MTNNIVITILTQYHVSKGMKIFKEDGAAAVLKELKQLHDRLVVEPKHPEDISTDEKRATLK